MFIFSICFTFGPVDLSIAQEATNILNKKKKNICSQVFCWRRKGSWEEKDYNSVGAIVQGAINEQSAAVGGSSWIPV